LKEDDSSRESEKEKKCKLHLKVKRPSGNGPWYAFGKIGGFEEGDDLTGHTFCAHIDEGGKKIWHGFYPKGAIVGWDNVSEEDRITGFGDFFKYVAGILYHGDERHSYDDERVYEITREKYDAAQQFAQQWESDKTKYSLALQNCTTFVIKDAAKAGCAVPWGGLFDNPHTFGKGVAKAKK
jgi:hypothetical protein